MRGLEDEMEKLRGLEGNDAVPSDEKTGFAHLVGALLYSLAGGRRLFQETAFRHQLLFAAAGVALFVFVHATLTEYLILAVICLFVFATEALNTAIEEIIDRISPEISSTGKHAKDLGSFAVFCMLMAGGLYIAWVVFT